MPVQNQAAFVIFYFFTQSEDKTEVCKITIFSYNTVYCKQGTVLYDFKCTIETDLCHFRVKVRPMRGQKPREEETGVILKVPQSGLKMV